MFSPFTRLCAGFTMVLLCLNCTFVDAQNPTKFCEDLNAYIEHSYASFDKLKDDSRNDMPEGRYHTNAIMEGANKCQIDQTFMPVCECSFRKSGIQGTVKGEYDQMALWVKNCLPEGWKLNLRASNEKYKGSSLEATSPDGRTLIEIGIAWRPDNEFELLMAMSRF